MFCVIDCEIQYFTNGLTNYVVSLTYNFLFTNVQGRRITAMFYGKA